MVLSAPPPDAQPGARPVAPWIERIANLLRLVERGIVLLVDGAVPSQLGPLVRGLCAEHPGLLVLTRAADIEAAPPGSVIVLAVRPEDAIWLNVARPIFAERALRVILWSSAETTRELARRAPDFFDWIARRIECPSGPPAFTVAGLRAALRARAWAVSFRGDGLEEAFKAAFPRRALIRADAALPDAALLGVAKKAGRGWIVWSNVVDDLAIRRVRDVVSRAGRRGRNLLDNPVREVQDAWPVSSVTADLLDAARTLENAGATTPARLSALLDLEPEAVSLAVELLRAGIPASDVEGAAHDAADPAAALGKIAGERSGIDPVLVAAYRVPAPLLRAFAADPRVRRASAVLAGAALPPLPPLTERLPAGESGAAEFGRLMLQLLKVRIGTGRLFRNTARGGATTGALAPDGFPPLTGAVAFHFHWPHEGADDVKSSLWRASRDKKLSYWVLLTPWDLAPAERDWARGSWRRPGLEVLQWGQTWIDQTLRKCPPLLARYYPHEARAYLPGYDGTDFDTLATSYRERVTRVHNRLKTIGIPPEGRPREGHADAPLVDHFIPPRLVREPQDAPPRDLATALSSEQAAVILADPGMGKSTLLAYVALVCSGAVTLEGFEPPPRALPLFISLRDFGIRQRQRPGLSFIDYLCIQARDLLHLPSVHPAFFESALRMGEAVVLFDGLDEVGNESARHAIAASIEAFRSEYPDCQIWVTSRIYGYTPDVRLPEPFSHFRIAPLDDARLDGFIARWYAHQISANPRDAHEQAESLRAAVRRTPGVRRLAGNPLLLTLLAFMHHSLRGLPRDRGELYEKCIEMGLRTWQEAKSGEHEHPDEATRISLDVPAQRDYLAHLALYSQERNQGGTDEESRGLLPRREVIDTLAARHLTCGRREHPELTELEARHEMERFLDHVCDQTGLLVDRGDDQIAFIHLSFQEYLAAWVFLCDSQVPQGPSFFVEHLGDPAWEEVLLLRLHVLFHQGGGSAQLDEVVSAMLRSLEHKSRPEGWLTLARAVRDDLDLSDRDTRLILTRVVEVCLDEPLLEGQWYSALEEVKLFSERARGKLRSVIANQRAAERDPARVVASVRLEVSLLGWSDDIVDALRARGDLAVLLPDLVPFVTA